MAEEEAKESAPEAEETQAQPAPKVSEPSEDKQPSGPKPVTEDRLAELLKDRNQDLLEQVEERIERQTQSVKDRRIAQLTKDVEELRTLKQRLDAVDGDWDRLEQEVERESLSRKIEDLEARVSGSDRGRSWDQEWQDESQRILESAEEELGVTISPEEYNAAFAGREFTSKGDAYAALNRLIVQKASGESVPSAAIATEGAETASPPPSDAVELTNKLEKLRAQRAPKAEIEEVYQQLQRALQ